MNEMDDHLSRIQTLWSKLLNPDAAGDEDGRQQQLLLRYYRAAFRYLLGIVRDAGVAEELAQDFAVRFMRGDFRNVDRQRGRFRDFLKTVLRNLCRDHWRKQQKAKEVQAGVDDAIEPPAPPEESSDAAFEDSWREELLAKTWEALAVLEQDSGKPFFTALCLKVQEPKMRSPELAAQLSKSLNRKFSADNLRQTLHRAREAFGNLLLREVELTLETDDPDRLAEEIADLQLLDYCRAALEERKRAEK
jgi:RNA polymerase sigma factor (sigma-70 family)